MRPELRPGRFVFVTVQRVPDDAAPVAWVREDEGVTLVLAQHEADRLGLPYEFVAAMITLRVHSSLDAVGLTALVSGTLAGSSISCNVLAGYFHDHIFVAVEHGQKALQLLRDLSAASS